MKRRLLILVLMTIAWAGNAQLKNLDFELWDNPLEHVNNRPTAWQWNSGISGQTGGYFYYPPSVDAQSNSYALKLSVWYTYAKDVAIQSAPISSRPVSLSGYYKYTDNVLTDGTGLVDDVAQVAVYLTRRNTVTRENDTIGKGIINLSRNENYARFNVPIEYVSEEVPDTIEVKLDPSMVKRNDDANVFAPGMGISSFFTVDNLSLEESSLGITDLTGNELMVYPNPFQDVLNITNFSGVATVFDTMGKKVLDRQHISQEKSLPTAQLPKGIYYLQLQDEAKTNWQKNS